MESPLRADMTLCIIETLRWQDGFHRLPQHLARLRQTCARLGVPYAERDVMQTLGGVRGTGPLRVRLSLGISGDPQVSFAPLPPDPPLWRLGLASARLASGDPWLRVKTTNRALYDHARATLPDTLEEVIFLNERGEVCEGTITTVFADTGSGMVTPPLACGLLPGILRAELLAQGLCREALLYPADLADARLWVGNALRGLIPAQWTAPLP